METREVISDFRRRYENTYVWLSMPDAERETLVMIEQIQDSDSKMAVLTLTSEEFGQMQVNFGSSEHTLRFKYPPVGVFQHDVHPYMFLRRPARQYRRGLCSDNSTMVNVSRNITGNIVRWSAAEVASAFRHEVSSYQTALSRLDVEKKLKGVALANEYSLVRSMVSDTKDHILFHWNHPIAYVSTTTGALIKCLEKSYEREIQDVIGGLV